MQINRHTSHASVSRCRRLGVGLALGVALWGGMAVAQAQEFRASRVGFVKLDRILKESAPAKLIQTKLEREFSTRQKDIAAQDATFKADVTKFQTDSPVLAEAARLERQKKLVEQERELQRVHRVFQEDLNRRKNEELQKLMASTSRVVQQLAATNKLDFVLQEAIYADPKNDLTDKALKMLESSAGQ